MKKFKIAALFGLLILANCSQPPEAATDESDTPMDSRDIYQLKTYIFDTDEQEQATDTYLETAFLPALHRLGMNSVGVFKPRPGGEDTVKKTIVLIPFSSLDQFYHLDDNLADDASYLQAGDSYINATHDNPPYARIESVVLRAFEFMPNLQPSPLNSPRPDRIYELRSYESPSEKIYRNKVDMFNAGGEIDLFDQLGFNAVFYGDVISGPVMPNLMYMTTFSDQASRDTHWKTFVDAPEWKEMSGLDKYQNNVSHIDIYFLYPTEYSDY